jgi:hypothetical protein
MSGNCPSRTRLGVRNGILHRHGVEPRDKPATRAQSWRLQARVPVVAPGAILLRTYRVSKLQRMSSGPTWSA